MPEERQGYTPGMYLDRLRMKYPYLGAVAGVVMIGTMAIATSLMTTKSRDHVREVVIGTEEG